MSPSLTEAMMDALLVGAGLMVATLGLTNPHPEPSFGPPVKIFAQASFTPPRIPESRSPWRQRPPFMPPGSLPQYEGTGRFRNAFLGAVIGAVVGAGAGYL